MHIKLCVLCVSVWRKWTSHCKSSPQQPQVLLPGKTDFHGAKQLLSRLSTQYVVAVADILLNDFKGCPWEQSNWLNHPMSLSRLKCGCSTQQKHCWTEECFAKRHWCVSPFGSAHGKTALRTQSSPRAEEQLRSGWIRGRDNTSGSIAAETQWGGILRERTAATLLTARTHTHTLKHKHAHLHTY